MIQRHTTLRPSQVPQGATDDLPVGHYCDDTFTVRLPRSGRIRARTVLPCLPSAVVHRVHCVVPRRSECLLYWWRNEQVRPWSKVFRGGSFLIDSFDVAAYWSKAPQYPLYSEAFANPHQPRPYLPIPKHFSNIRSQSVTASSSKALPEQDARLRIC